MQSYSAQGRHMPLDYTRLRALVVDDNAFTRRLIQEVLYNLGVSRDNLAEAKDGLDALDILETGQFDFVISDWHMEPMDGLTLARKIRDPIASPAPHLPLILCTADPRSDVITRALQIGVNQVIMKPINIADFDKRLRMMFETQPVPVKSASYIGPDRRFDHTGRPTADDRRSHDSLSDDAADADTIAKRTSTPGVPQ
jgi:CheY-like chemotaxis protein